MHRTSSVPRLLCWWSLAIALTLHAGIHAVHSQTLFPPGSQSLRHAQHIELAVGMTRACKMTTRADLKRVENPNSRVVRVERIADKNNEILLVAEQPGRTLITFVDQNDKAEVHEVIVTALGDPKVKTVKMTLEKGKKISVPLDQLPKGGVTVDHFGIAEHIEANDGKSITFHAKEFGTARFTLRNEKKEIFVIYEINVPTLDRVEQLKRTINDLAPTGAVKVTPLVTPGVNEKGEKVETQSVLLTGTVTNPQDARAVVEAAERLFPPSTLGQQVQAQGGAAIVQSQLRSNVINQIRVGGVHQVQLEVVVAVVNRSEVRNMSFSFAQNGNNWFISSFFGPPFTFANALTQGGPASIASALNATGSANLPFGVVNSKNGFMGFLQALRTENLAKVLAEPRVVTLSGRPANIVSGGETPLLTSSGQGAPSISYKPFGTIVNATPIVMGNNKIYLEVQAEISDIDQSLSISIPGITPTIVPGFRKRSAQVAVQIEDGQTLAIGGLIQNTINASVTRVPFLGDIPFFGAAFSQKSYTETEQELVILVTPRLVDPVDCTKIPKYLPGRETRSPDDFELFLEGILEAPRGPRSVVFHPHYYKGAHMNSSNIGQIPCGDGNCFGRSGPGCSTGNCGVNVGLPMSNTRLVEERQIPTASPLPSFPSVPAIPVSNPRIVVEPEAPSVMPPVREMPTAPTIPTPRQLDTRPLLPSISR